ncbi:MAG: hypothetical protein R3C45_16845 [Phycisphaerales bacterium]
MTSTPIDITGIRYIPDRQVIEDFRTTASIIIVVFSFDPFFNYDFDQDTPGVNHAKRPVTTSPGYMDVSEPLGLIDFGSYGVFTPLRVPDRVEVTFNTQPDEIVSQAAVSGSTSSSRWAFRSSASIPAAAPSPSVQLQFRGQPGRVFSYDSAFNQDGSASGLARIDSILTYGNEATITLIETNVAVTPEPASAAVLALGGVALLRRRD